MDLETRLPPQCGGGDKKKSRLAADLLVFGVNERCLVPPTGPLQCSCSTRQKPINGSPRRLSDFIGSKGTRVVPSQIISPCPGGPPFSLRCFRARGGCRRQKAKYAVIKSLSWTQSWKGLMTARFHLVRNSELGWQRLWWLSFWVSCLGLFCRKQYFLPRSSAIVQHPRMRAHFSSILFCLLLRHTFLSYYSTTTFL